VRNYTYELNSGIFSFFGDNDNAHFAKTGSGQTRGKLIERAVFEQSICKNDHFAKTGLGQIGKVEKKGLFSVDLSVGYMNSVFGRYDEDRSGELVRTTKTPLLCCAEHSIRCAENDDFTKTGSGQTRQTLSKKAFVAGPRGVREVRSRGKETQGYPFLLCHLIPKLPSFYQDRLGTHTGKTHSTQRRVFFSFRILGGAEVSSDQRKP
jgi:hypothetical protein